MKKVLLLILFMITIINVKGQKRVFGFYGKCEKHFMACRQIHLKKDSTFAYHIFMDVGGWQTSEGKWTRNGDTIIFNTYEQPIEDKDTNEFSFDKSIKGTLIKMSLDSNQEKRIKIVVNNSEFIDTVDYNETIIIPDTIKIEKLIFISMSPNRDGIIYFSSKNINKNKITMNSIDPKNIVKNYDMGNRHIMTNEQCIIKNNTLHFHFKDEDGDYEYSLKKTNKKNRVYKEK